MFFEREDGLALKDVISAIKRELQVYENATNDGQDLGLELVDVDVNLAVKNIRKADGGVGIGISFFGIGGKVAEKIERSSENVSTLSVKLMPPEQGFAMAKEDGKHLDLASTLIDARVQLLAGISENPVLRPTFLSLELKFVAVKGGGPSGEFEFKVIGGKASDTASRADTQTVKLTFKEPEDL